MPKDPAFLFYPGDWMLGTLGMSFEEKGAYLELLILQFNRGCFTIDNAKSALKGRFDEIWPVVKDKFVSDGSKYWNERLKLEKEKREAFTDSRRKSRLKSDEDNVRIYIVRDNVRKTYKIGSSVNPIRRYNELNNQISPAIMNDPVGQRNITLIWYSEAVKRSEESIIHEKFKKNNIYGEWFELSDNDLGYIFKKYKGTYLERTFNLTENENEN